MQPCRLRPLQQDHLDRLRPACGPGPRRGPAREPLHLPLNGLMAGGAPVSAPLAGPASRQGRAVADHLFGHGGQRSPVLGTAIVRVFGTVAATTGLSEKALRAAGIAHHAVHLHPNHHAGYYPGARPVHLKLLFAPGGRVLGARPPAAAAWTSGSTTSPPPSGPA